MAELPFPWNIYEEKQKKLLRSHRVNESTWGLERGLDTLLAAVAKDEVGPEIERDFDRAVASRRWTERNRARLRRKYLQTPPEFDPIPQHHPASFSPRPVENQLYARIRTSRMRENVSPREWQILLGAAAGHECQAIAGVCGGSAGSIRTALSRLRARLRLVA